MEPITGLKAIPTWEDEEIIYLAVIDTATNTYGAIAWNAYWNRAVENNAHYDTVVGEFNTRDEALSHAKQTLEEMA